MSRQQPVSVGWGDGKNTEGLQNRDYGNHTRSGRRWALFVHQTDAASFSVVCTLETPPVMWLLGEPPGKTGAEIWGWEEEDVGTDAYAPCSAGPVLPQPLPVPPPLHTPLCGPCTRQPLVAQRSWAPCPTRWVRRAPDSRQIRGWAVPGSGRTSRGEPSAPVEASSSSAGQGHRAKPRTGKPVETACVRTQCV